jgi:hypothetical protein
MTVKPPTGTMRSVASANTSTTLLAANGQRRHFTIFNESTAILYVDLTGGVVSATSYTVQVGANGFYELPGTTVPIGLITGIWSAVNGNARITEWA